MKGGRRRGRQRKRWEDNIREWTGLEFAKSQRAVENTGKKWRKLAAKSSMCRNDPRGSVMDDKDDDDEFLCEVLKQTVDVIFLCEIFHLCRRKYCGYC